MSITITKHIFMNETWGGKMKTQTRKQSQNIGLITILNIKVGGKTSKETKHKFSSKTCNSEYNIFFS